MKAVRWLMAVFLAANLLAAGAGITNDLVGTGPVSKCLARFAVFVACTARVFAVFAA
ncbi:hypothetical protein [Pseudogulbenkiania subflava]|uniref:Uncharacterized protein n=1 Tax=Pseudogulbenkiania subflava DSM 22618 TaxID=1123014 RepID=A0A1Y6C5B4_9NEIS|nr:hypothetical protein [Pseudogulbenkiania subflava]SMF44640.1 hypothetical protein SAMN02745746_03326 [Pseudogulbenkiania subflava DSM 22618]